MRILFFGNPVYGHIIPELPLARALREQGHTVAFLTGGYVADLLASEGFEHLVAGPAVIPDLVLEVERTTGVNVLMHGVTVETEAEVFAGARIDLGYEDMVAVARPWRPELIVAEMYDFVGPMIGAALGVPVATLALGPAIRPESVEALRVRSEARHREHGVEPVAASWYLDSCPASLQIQGWQAPETWIGLRPEAYSGGGQTAVIVVDGTHVRPRVLVSFGTLFVIPEVITPIVRELLKQDLDVRVALGPSHKADDFELDPARVEFVGFTPLAQLLTDVDLVLTVGGSGTVFGALAHGIPLVLTPQGADQPINAELAATAGAGIAFPLGQAEPAAVAAAVGTVLAEPGYRLAALRIAAEIAALPGAAEVAERLVADLD